MGGYVFTLAPPREWILSPGSSSGSFRKDLWHQVLLSNQSQFIRNQSAASKAQAVTIPKQKGNVVIVSEEKMFGVY